MTARAIVDYIAEHDLRSVTGATPEATVGAVLYTSIQNGSPVVRLLDAGVFAHTGHAAPASPNLQLGRLESVRARFGVMRLATSLLGYLATLTI